MSADPTTKLVALAGNPNTGKTTLFNQLTGSRAKVGNYPGVTVERREAALVLEPHGIVTLVDVPGTYSLCARAREEQVAIRAVAGWKPDPAPDCVVVVVDATQLSRNLYLTVQLIELDVPVVVALNMVDMLAETGERIEIAALERGLGVPVVGISALRGEGLAELRAAIARVLADPASARPGFRWRVPEGPLERDIAAVADAIPEEWTRPAQDGPPSERRRTALGLWALLSIDEHDELEDVPAALRARTLERLRGAQTSGRNLEEEVIGGRYAWIEALVARARVPATSSAASRTDRIDHVLLHPVAGFALFLLAMVFVFQSLFAGADPAVSWIESAQAWLQDQTRALLPAGLLSDLLADGVIGGVGSVIVFLPQILLLFFFIGLMEDSGYMARVAYLMDRLMSMIGLHGRAFVPMLSGFACAVPAILAVRTMERQRDRLLTMMVVPLMTCSARLPVYGLLIAALAPIDGASWWQQGGLMVAMYLFSTLIALVAAAVLGRTVLRGPKVPLILEMPPYRMPHWKSLLRSLLERARVFLSEAGTKILVCSLLMWALLYFPRPAPTQEFPDAGAPAAEQIANSYGGRLGRAIEPAIEPLGFDWRTGIGLIGAFAAREVFVSTMGVVYGIEGEADETSEPLRDRLRSERRADGTRLFTPLSCLSLMVFFAIACQCMSTLAVVRRESNSWRWPAFLFGYTLALAWLCSFAVYQGGKLLGFA
ncbi:MAG: ferrous iron transport protein B [Planctomycetes bacterium]|nr:ferrous iron transport protein B [Planctomycetota bacterium]